MCGARWIHLSYCENVWIFKIDGTNERIIPDAWEIRGTFDDTNNGGQSERNGCSFSIFGTWTLTKIKNSNPDNPDKIHLAIELHPGQHRQHQAELSQAIQRHLEVTTAISPTTLSTTSCWLFVIDKRRTCNVFQWTLAGNAQHLLPSTPNNHPLVIHGSTTIDATGYARIAQD